jgi:hypothetical protein
MTQDNYDLDTTDGMANAIAWTENCLSLIRTGGTWFVPRSGTVVTVLNHSTKLCKVLSTLPDPSIERVLRAAGWRINPAGYSEEKLERDNPNNAWMQEH